MSKSKLKLAVWGLLLVLLSALPSSALTQGEGTLIDEDTIVIQAATEKEMQEFHHRSKRQVMFYPSYGQTQGQQQQMVPLGQTQQYQFIPQQMQQQRFIYPQQQQQQSQQSFAQYQPIGQFQQPQQAVQLQVQQPQSQPQSQQSQRFGRQIAQVPSNGNGNGVVRPDGSCKTKHGDAGTCVSLVECYPYITINNQPTIDLLMRISTPCSSDSAPNVILTQTQQSFGSMSQQQDRAQPQPQLRPQFLQKSQQTICCPGGPPLKKHQTQPQPQPQPQPTPPAAQRPATGTLPPAWHPPKNTVQPDGRRWDKSMLPPYLQNLVPPNSTPVPIQKYPWTVAIMMGERHHCGGSLLTPSTVITAAHCVHMLDSFAVANLRVLLGHHDISSGARREAVTRRVIKSIYHSGFSMRTLHNDIALLILDQPVSTESAKISTVKLCTEPIASGTVTIAGWGQMGWTLPSTPMLMETTIDIWNNRKCAAVYGALAPGGITQNMICGTAVGKDACRGDSGGPLMMKRQYGYEQIGVVSWGIECGRYPSVHTRITSFLPWIQKNRVD